LIYISSQKASDLLIINYNSGIQMKLTRAEEELMQIIWDLGPCMVSQIREILAQQANGKKPPHSTISTIVRILEEKGYLTHKAYGKTYEYRPLITRKEYSKNSLKRLVNNYFDGSMERLVSFMVKEDDFLTS